jgi:SNF family Na+-dependent transporter
MCIVVSCDCFTGIFAGFAVFATIGFLAKELKGDVTAYAEASGPGLAFITYPEAFFSYVTCTWTWFTGNY